MFRNRGYIIRLNLSIMLVFIGILLGLKIIAELLTLLFPADSMVAPVFFVGGIPVIVYGSIKYLWPFLYKNYIFPWKK